MSTQSEAIVGFIANLLPLYDGERHNNLWCARSLADGTLIMPTEESDDDGIGWVRVRWQGDQRREREMHGDMFASLALERYVRLHGVGYSEEAIAGELWYMARHFHFKTGCEVYFPQLREPPSRLRKVGRAAARMGQGVLVNVFSKAMRLG